jgi:hypothetical protein
VLVVLGLHPQLRDGQGATLDEDGRIVGPSLGAGVAVTLVVDGLDASAAMTGDWQGLFVSALWHQALPIW